MVNLEFIFFNIMETSKKYPYGYELIIQDKTSHSVKLYISSGNNYLTRSAANKHRLKDVRKEINKNSQVELNVLTIKADYDQHILIFPLKLYLIDSLINIIADYLPYKTIEMNKIISGTIRYNVCALCNQKKKPLHGLVGRLPKKLEFDNYTYLRYICLDCS